MICLHFIVIANLKYKLWDLMMVVYGEIWHPYTQPAESDLVICNWPWQNETSNTTQMSMIVFEYYLHDYRSRSGRRGTVDLRRVYLTIIWPVTSILRESDWAALAVGAFYAVPFATLPAVIQIIHIIFTRH